MQILTKVRSTVGPTPTELLLRHRPVLIWDSQALFRATCVETIAAIPGNRVTRADVVVAEVDGDEGMPALTPDFLAADGDVTHTSGDRLDFAGPPAVAAARFVATGLDDAVAYGRLVASSGDIWLQYWLWFYHQPLSPTAITGRQGNWELLQIRLSSELRVTAVTVSQRGLSVRAEPGDVRWSSCDPPCGPGCIHPELYVAAWSHALCVSPGINVHPLGIDRPDGSGAGHLPDVRPFGAWAQWSGRWGAGAAWDFNLELSSPRSPARRLAWRDPLKAERIAVRQWSRLRGLAHRLLSLLLPPTPEITSAVLERDTVSVKWRAATRARWLMITVHDVERPELVIGQRLARTRRRSGHSRVILRAPPDEALVRVSALTMLRLRSQTSPAEPVMRRRPMDPGRPLAREEWSLGIWKAFRRRLLRELTTNGAASISELERRQLSMLELALDRVELQAVVDSSRRLGLVKPLESAIRPDGPASPDIEWAPTADGRKHAQSAFDLGLRLIATVPPALLLAGVSALIKTQIRDASVVVQVLVAVGAVQLLVLGTLAIHRLLVAGATRRAIAERWSRHAVELPALNRYYASRLILYSASMFFGGVAGAYAIAAATTPDSAWVWLPGAPALVGEVILLLDVWIRLDRRSALRKRARGLLDDQMRQMRGGRS
jgi:hypothetical protein